MKGSKKRGLPGCLSPEAAEILYQNVAANCWLNGRMGFEREQKTYSFFSKIIEEVMTDPKVCSLCEHLLFK